MTVCVWARATAKLVAKIVLPTPPFCLTIAITGIATQWYRRAGTPRFRRPAVPLYNNCDRLRELRQIGLPLRNRYGIDIRVRGAGVQLASALLPTSTCSPTPNHTPCLLRRCPPRAPASADPFKRCSGALPLSVPGNCLCPSPSPLLHCCIDGCPVVRHGTSKSYPAGMPTVAFS